MRVLLLVAVLALLARADDDWKPLFDGKTAKGWLNPYDWGEVWVEDGVVHLKGDRKFFLVSEKTYGDFVITWYSIECMKAAAFFTRSGDSSAAMSSYDGDPGAACFPPTAASRFRTARLASTSSVHCCF